MSRVTFRSYAARQKRGIRRTIDENAEEAGQTYINEMRKLLLRGTRSGESYRIPGGKRARYTASAPGEPPAARTGDYARSWDMVKAGEGARLVGTPLIRGRYLELGTKNMAPRPHVRKLMRSLAGRLRRILGKRAN